MIAKFVSIETANRWIAAAKKIVLAFAFLHEWRSRTLLACWWRDATDQTGFSIISVCTKLRRKKYVFAVVNELKEEFPEDRSVTAESADEKISMLRSTDFPGFWFMRRMLACVIDSSSNKLKHAAAGFPRIET